MGLITADVETASSVYARRFGGPLGAWLLSVQTSLIARALASGGCEGGCSLLDVGGGHDQIAAPLESLGYRVTVSSSSLTATEMIRKRKRGGVVACNLVSQPFGSRFDAVTCIRLLTHSGEEWRALVAEMCRLAERAVIIDYPPLVSFNLLYPILFSIKRRLEGDTRTFALFLHREIETEFKKHGFMLKFRSGQFLLPMVVHRVLNCRGVSRALEQPGRVIGLARVLGSPVIACFERAGNEA